MADLVQTSANVVNVDCDTDTKTAGETIVAGDMLYASNSTTVMKAKCSSTAAIATFVGMAACGAAVNQPVIYFKPATGKSFKPGATLTVGQEVWLSPNFGKITATVGDVASTNYKNRLGIATATDTLRWGIDSAPVQMP